MNSQTHTKIRYSSLSKLEKEEICNGCGPKGWIKPPKSIFFKSSCNKHDWFYWVGASDYDRKIADEAFYNAMKEDCSTLFWFKRPFYLSWSYLYYKMVRMNGKKYFYYGELKRYPDRSLA